LIQEKKVAGINKEAVRNFEAHLNEKDVAEATKEGYFSAFVQFPVFLEIETDFQRPKELTLRQQRFVSKRN
jgi:hypothetical protein